MSVSNGQNRKRVRKDQIKKVSRKERIKRAVELIGPDPDCLDECKALIDFAHVVNRGVSEGLKDIVAPTTKPFKRSAKKYRDHLKLALAALKEMPSCSLYHNSLRQNAENGISYLEKEIEWIEKLLSLESVPPRCKSFDEYEAVRYARFLLEKYGRDKIPISRKGEWCRLSAILYGTPGADFYNYVRAFNLQLRST